MKAKKQVIIQDSFTRVELLQNYPLMPGGRVRYKGTVLDVTREKAKEMIEKNIAKEIL